MDLTRERWAKLKPRERTAAAKALAGQLPEGFTFEAVRVCQLGTRKNAVAFFTQGDARFALIPGGPVQIGYDTNRPWEPTAEEEESWAGTKADYGLRGSICQHIARAIRVSAQIADPLASVQRGDELTPGVDLRQPQPGWAVPLGLCFLPTDL